MLIFLFPFARNTWKDYHISKHNSFYTIGLSYKKADAEIRGRFSLNDAAIDNLLTQAKLQGIDGLLVTSTCNRTELHGFAQAILFNWSRCYATIPKAPVEEFQDVAYVYKNNDAISHLFKVGTGLDSQILGDFEIISQLRQSFNRSKKREIANPFIERLCNSVIQASKRIKKRNRNFFRGDFRCLCIRSIYTTKCR